MPPNTVNAARKDYQKSMNPLASFVNVECVLDGDSETPSETPTSEVWQRFISVASPEEHKIVKGIGSFGLYLTKLGFESIHRKEGNIRMGIRLRELDEIDADTVDAINEGEGVKGKGGNLLQIPMNIFEYHDTCRKNGLYPSPIHDVEEYSRDLDDIVDMLGNDDADDADGG